MTEDPRCEMTLSLQCLMLDDFLGPLLQLLRQDPRLISGEQHVELFTNHEHDSSPVQDGFTGKPH